MIEANRLRFFELVERYNQLGTMLPAPGDFNSDDIEAVATVRVVIAAMRTTRQQMDAVLDAEMRLRSKRHRPSSIEPNKRGASNV
jgi:hypothetical protein